MCGFVVFFFAIFQGVLTPSLEGLRMIFVPEDWHHGALNRKNLYQPINAHVQYFSCNHTSLDIFLLLVVIYTHLKDY